MIKESTKLASEYVIQLSEENYQDQHVVESLLPRYLVNLIKSGPLGFKSTYCEIRQYLLSWNILLNILQSIDSEKKQYLTDYIRFKSDAFAGFISEVFEHVVYANLRDLTTMEIFLSCDELSPVSPPTNIKTQEPMKRLNYMRSQLKHIHTFQVFYPILCAKIFFKILRDLPSFSRNWWNDCDRNTSLMVSSITSQFFSGVLIQDEVSQYIHFFHLMCFSRLNALCPVSKTHPISKSKAIEFFAL